MSGSVVLLQLEAVLILWPVATQGPVDVRGLLSPETIFMSMGLAAAYGYEGICGSCYSKRAVLMP